MKYNKEIYRLYKLTKKILYVVLSILILLIIWDIIAMLVNNELIFPTFNQALIDFGQQLQSKIFYQSFLLTIIRTLISFCIAVLLAIMLYMLHKTCEFMASFINMIVSILRSVPTIAIILLLLIWTNSIIAPSIISILIVMPILYASLQSFYIDKKLLNFCAINNIVGRRYFCFVIVPQVQKQLLPTFASSLALNLKIMVAGEVLANTYLSLGGLMHNASVYFEMGQLLALAFVTIITAILLQKIMELCKFIKFKVKITNN